jgi:hypothetical protein
MRRLVSWHCISSPLYHLYRISKHLNIRINLNSRVIYILDRWGPELLYFVLFLFGISFGGTCLVTTAFQRWWPKLMPNSGLAQAYEEYRLLDFTAVT